MHSVKADGRLLWEGSITGVLLSGEVSGKRPRYSSLTRGAAVRQRLRMVVMM